MILRSSFIKLQKEDMKRRIWSIALLSLLFFIVLPVFNALNLESYSIADKKEWIIESMLRYIGPQQYVVAVLTIAAAVICGISGFFYLHSKKQVDFYHSIPVSRKALFAVNYINGFYVFFIPYIINIILSIIIIAIKGFLYQEVLQAAIVALVINTVYFSMIYTIVVIAVMLTGNFIISCFGTAVLLLYGPTLSLIKELYFRHFFRTYYPEIRLESSIKFLSPIWVYAGVIERWSNKDNIVNSIIIALVVTILLISFALFLYLRRPSEAAGKAMSYEVSKPVIKLMVVVLLSLGGGALFFNIVNNSDGWFIFGLIFSLLVVYAVIEIIYNFDIRGAFRHKKQLLLSALIVGIIACGFRFDVFHFDSYLPEKADIQSMSVAVEGLEDNIGYFEYNINKREWFDGTEYQLEKMKLTDTDVAYELAKLGAESTIGVTRENDHAVYYMAGQNEYTVKILLKNGKSVYRKYSMDMIRGRELLSKLYASEEYKTAHYPIYRWKTEEIGQISLRYFTDIYNAKEFGLDGKDSFHISGNSVNKQNFLTTYKEELMTLKLEEMADTVPLASLSFEVNTYEAGTYYIYPSFTRTIALLKQYGFDIASKEVKTEDVERIEIVDYRAPEEEEATTYAGKNNTDDGPYTYTDKEEIGKILPVLIPRDYYYSNYAVLSAEMYCDVMVVVYNPDYNDDVSYSYLFKKNEIPDFVKEDMN